jgi:hypothetical protein
VLDANIGWSCLPSLTGRLISDHTRRKTFIGGGDGYRAVRSSTALLALRSQRHAVGRVVIANRGHKGHADQSLASDSRCCAKARAIERRYASKQ